MKVSTGASFHRFRYYPFGLRIAAISSVKLGDPNEGSLKNNYLYNDKELFDDADLDWYDYGFRNYDPQIGRFPQFDPLTDDYPYYTPYQFAGDEPIANLDLDGLEPLDALSAIPTGAMAAEKSLAPVVVMGLSQVAKSSGTFFSAVGNFLSKAGSSLINGAKGFINEMNRRSKINIAKDIDWIKSTAKQLEANRKANWASGNTLIQEVPKDFMENPLEFLDGGGELDVLEGLGMESEFKSFSSFKRSFGRAGEGQAWHHIVEQTPSNIAKFGPESIHNTDNLIRIEHGSESLHAKVSGYYSSKQAFTNGKTVRQWLSSQSFQEQYDFGIKILKKFGWKP